MIFGIVGPEDSVKQVCDVVKAEHVPVQILPLIYQNFSETENLVKNNQEHVDAFLFTGRTPYDLAIRRVVPVIPWEFIKTSEVDLLLALLTASQKMGYDISRISYDAIHPSKLRQSLTGSGITFDQIVVMDAELPKNYEDHINTIVNFHRSNYLSGNVTCCIVGMAEAWKLLKQQKIPSVFVKRNRDAIISAINKLRITMYQSQGLRRIAVIALQIGFAEQHPAYSQSAIEQNNLYCQAGNIVHRFAQKIGAAAIQTSLTTYYLFTQEQVIRNETDGYKNFTLLQEFHSMDIVKNIFLGIGLDENSFIAKQGADSALRKALSGRTSQVFIVENNRSCIGPVFLYDSFSGGGNREEKSLINLSIQTGVSIQKLRHIYSVLQQNEISVITPLKLAEICGMRPRNMNRILEQLAKSGCVIDVGKEIKNGKGRPGRLIRLIL